METSFPLERLGDHCLKIGSGATPKGGKGVYLDEGEFALIRSQNVYNNQFSLDGLAYITPEAAEKLDGVTVEEDDVLLNITGNFVARCCSVPSSVLPARVKSTRCDHPTEAERVCSSLHSILLGVSGATRSNAQPCSFWCHQKCADQRNDRGFLDSKTEH